MFQDEAHIYRIREKLWLGREHGQAAVMVGAGFSLNAQSIRACGVGFPTWRVLSEGLVDGLFPTQSDQRKHASEQACSISGSLRLAQEYEAAFGRDALESYLRHAIPDDALSPGPLHSLLLSLPWSDVLTTNYDTLLERAARAQIDRKYDVITTVSDIPGAMRPRIVKLHGTFPSTRPFIVTEEDFRTYPRRFAPFVNLAQQSIMENVFCLVGFSGDDPNFLYWSGWVRDFLGPSAPQLYLVGLLDLNAAKRKLLEGRNVVPIDLSPLFPKHAPSVTNRHAAAIEWFLLSLVAGKPASRQRWPSQSTSEDSGTSIAGLKPLPSRTTRAVSEKAFPGHEEDPALQLSALQATWQHNRGLYPGWLVAPRQARISLWRNTEHWLNYIERHIAALDGAMRTSLLHELCWRLQTCLVPLWSDIVTVVSDATSHPESSSESRIFLGFSLLEYARQNDDEVLWQHWAGKLGTLVTDVDYKAKLSYERCLLALGRLDAGGARAELAQWPAGQASDSYWPVRKAAILAELGDLNAARQIAEDALASIRRRLQPLVEDLALFSREAWAMMVVALLRDAQSHRFGRDAEFTGRWEALSRYECDPWGELSWLDAHLQYEPPSEPKSEDTRHGFDPGRVNVSWRMVSDGSLGRLLPAINMGCLIETSGLIARAGMYSLASERMVKAADWLETVLPHWALSLHLRAGKTEKLSSFFSRAKLASMATDQIQSLYRRVAKSVDSGDDQVKANEDLLLELLSRLTVRLNADQLGHELTRACRLYRALSDNQKMPGPVLTLMRRVFEAYPDVQLSERLVELFELPIPGESGFLPTTIYGWRDPVDMLDRQLSCKPTPVGTWSAIAERLLVLAATDQRFPRQPAIMRLAMMFDWGLLDKHQITRFGHILWAITNSENGLPIYTGLLDSSILALPGLDKSEAISRIRAYYGRLPLSRCQRTVIDPKTGKTHTEITITSGAERVLREVVAATKHRWSTGDLVEWSEDELMAMLDQLEAWWTDEGAKLSNEGGMVRQEWNTRVHWIIELIRNVLIPGGRICPGVLDRAFKLLDDLGRHGAHIASAHYCVLLMQPTRLNEVKERYLRAIMGTREDEAADAIGGAYLWLRNSHGLSLPPVPSELWLAIASVVNTRRLISLEPSLRYLALAIEKKADSFDRASIGMLVEGLRHLAIEATYATSQRGMSIDEIPAIRCSAARLAKALQIRGLSDDGVVETWLKMAMNDPLPEVRRVVENQSEEALDEV